MTWAGRIPTIPGVVEVVLSNNKCFGDKWKNPKAEKYSKYQSEGRIHDIDKDQSGWAALCDAMKGSGIQKLGFADIGLGPIGMKTLAATIPTTPGVVEGVISGNKCFGEGKYQSGDPNGQHDIDKDQSGWSALCESFKGTSIQKLGMTDIGIGPIGITTLADTIPTICLFYTSDAADEG